MTQKRHYHPLAALRFLRKTVLLCLLPLANALLEFSLSALLTACLLYTSPSPRD